MTARHELSYRRAGEGDMKDAFVWRNEEVARKASFDSKEIPWEEHAAWFLNSLKNNGREMWIIALDKKGIGILRFDVEGDSAVVSISITPEVRKLGYGKTALADMCGRYFGDNQKVAKIIARVKPGNEASLRAFEAAGFKAVVKGDKIIELTLGRPKR